MRNVSSAFLRALENDKRDYRNRLVITLADNTVINIDNQRIWENGIQIQDAVSADNSFQIGAAIINQGTFIINNIYDEYSEFSFDGAKVVVYTGLENLDDGSSEEIKLGTFNVDETNYDGSLITLTCFDNMSKFDRAYDTSLIYPTTLLNIVVDACSECGVSLDNSSLTFPHNNYIVTNKPSGENTTYRQIISWAAQIAGCFARCNSDGKLELKWFDTTELDNVFLGLDGGVFDGEIASLLSDYMNTESGMTSISSTTEEDTWFRIDNSIDLEFNGMTSDYIFIDSDSCYAFSNQQPANHGHIDLNDVNVCTRNGQSTSINYQSIDVGSRRVIKIRWSGYTKPGPSSQTSDYALEYEIFFTDKREILINFITLPTDPEYLGSSCVIEHSISTTYEPSTEIGTAIYSYGTKWVVIDFSSSYTTGDDADGGSFDPWDTGDVYDGGSFTSLNSVHFIRSSYSSNISTDDVVITGVKVFKKIINTDGLDETVEYSCGTDGYVIVVDGNDFVDSDHGQDVADWLGLLVNGVAFRKADISHPSDPSMEAGDVAVYIDRKENIYRMLVSSTTFTTGNEQRTLSSAETPAKNSSQRYTEATRSYMELRSNLNKQRTEWEEARDDLSERIDNAGGLYCTEVTVSGSTKTYYHNKPLLADSDIRMLFSDVGFTLSSDGGVTWYGMTVDGTMIAAILNAVGVNANWIRTGNITIGGTSGNVNGELRIMNASGQTIVNMSKDGADIMGEILTYRLSDGYASKMINGRTYYYGGKYTYDQLVNAGWSDAFGTISAGLASSSGSANDLKGIGIISPADFILIGDQTGENTYWARIIVNTSNTTIDGFSERIIMRSSSIRVTNGNINISDGSVQLAHGNILTSAGHIQTTSGSLYILDGSVFLKNASATNSHPVVWAYSDNSGKQGLLGYTENAHRFQTDNTDHNAGLYVRGDFAAAGTKSRVVDTEHYGTVAMNAFETSGSHFADIGSGTVGTDGAVTIFFDPVFEETIETNAEYQVFLTRTSQAETSWVDKRNGFFIVHGDSGATFDWMIVGYQRNYVTNRMETIDTTSDFCNDEPIAEDNMDAINAVEEMVERYNNELEV